MHRAMRTMVVAVVAALAGLVSVAGHAADWPERPIHLLVPFPAGSSSDIVARLLAQNLGQRLSQSVVVEDRPGAGGTLASETVAHAKPDGYTIGLANTSTHALSPSLLAKPPYDPTKDFAPISMIGASPLVLALHPGLPIHSVQELIAKAKAAPGKITVAESGPTTLASLAGVLFENMAKIKLTLVSYRGTEQEVLDVIEGRVDMQVATIPPTLHLIRQGKVRAIASTGAKRSPALPEVPTIAESGLPGYEAVLWQALYAPAGTPTPIVARLNTEVNAILHDKTVVETLAKLGIDPEPSTSQQLADRIAADIKKWHDVVVGAGIKPQ